MEEDNARIRHVLKLYLGQEVALLNLLDNHIKLEVLNRSEVYWTIVKEEDDDYLKLKFGEQINVVIITLVEVLKKCLLELGRLVKTS